MGILLYPYFLIVFWYKDFFLSSLRLSWEIFVYIASLLSVPLLLSTFFKPLKNEYREGLVFFSVIMGIFVKTLLLAVLVPILLFIAAVLLLICLGIMLLPFLLIWFVISR